MTAFDYARSQQTAKRLLDRFGKVGKIRATGQPDVNVKMAVMNYDIRQIDGTRVTVADRRIYVSPIDETGAQVTSIPVGAKLINAAGVPYVVIGPSPFEPADVTVYFDVQGRGPK